MLLAACACHRGGGRHVPRDGIGTEQKLPFVVTVAPAMAFLIAGKNPSEIGQALAADDLVSSEA